MTTSTQVEVTSIRKQGFATPGVADDPGFRWAYELTPVGSIAGGMPMTILDTSPTLYKPGQVLDLTPTKA